jgi:hypothetical protein
MGTSALFPSRMETRLILVIVQDRYVCIEPGYVKQFKTLAPGEEWIGQQVLRID